jgi:Leucine-rich repeat (LRR) protein
MRFYGNWMCLFGILLASCAGFFGCNKSDSNVATPDIAIAPNATPSASNAPPSSDNGRPSASQAKPEDIALATQRLKAMGSEARFLLKGESLTEIIIQDGSNLAADDLSLFGKLTDLEKLQVYNCRILNDEMVSQLVELQKLKTLALTNTVISDASVETIVKAFPNLIDLDLSSNTNMSGDALKLIAGLQNMQRLSLVQNRFNELHTRRLSKLLELRSLDLRGNMEAGDMTLEVVAKLPKLTAFKHRSTAVSDYGMEHLSQNEGLENLLIQDFAITSQSGPLLAKLQKLSQLEIFRCQGFGTEGVLALKGLSLQRLTLRDLPNVDDQAMAVLSELPKLRRLYLHELDGISDEGLKNLASLQVLELLDIWSVPQMTDATVEVIALLPNLKELSIRTTSVTDASIEKLLKMHNLQSLTFKENGSVTAEGLKKLSVAKSVKLDVGSSEPAEQ